MKAPGSTLSSTARSTTPIPAIGSGIFARDAALATQGVMVVRFTHNQLIRDPVAIRAQVRSILSARRHP
jgi:hypothetical protein